MASEVPILNGTLDRSHWLLQIYELVDQNNLADPLETAVSVFRLPESFREGDPAAYLPGRVWMGPYHHFRTEFNKMDLFKLEKIKKNESGPEIHNLAKKLKSLEFKIRGCYDESLPIDAETLSWVLLIDGLFLIHLLQNKYDSNFLKRPLEAQIVSDMVKLENQIPLFVLKEICPQEPIDYLAPLFYKFSSSISLFGLPCFKPSFNSPGWSSSLPEIFNLSHHLLHLLYFQALLIADQMAVANKPVAMDGNKKKEGDSYYPYFRASFLREMWNILGSVTNIAFIQPAKESFDLIQRLFKLLSSITKPNLAEERNPLIPSASDLKTVGVTFEATRNGILMCRFDETTLTLTLPSIHLAGMISQVLLKNLMAFETMAELNPPCLANYIVLMSGLLRNSKDLKVLENVRIVHNHLNSEEEAVEFFNGVENSTISLKNQRVANIPLHRSMDLDIGIGFIQNIKVNYELGLEAMIEKINKFYESCWIMKIKKIVGVILRSFASLFVVFLIVLVIAHFVCSSYISCPNGIFKTSIALHQMY